MIRRRWRRARQLRAARRVGWLVAVAAALTFVQSGWGQAPISGASRSRRTARRYQSRPRISSPFYLALPAHASSLVKDTLAAAMPSSAHYRHFSSVATLGAKFGASARQCSDHRGCREVRARARRSTPAGFTRVSGSAGKWASALKAPLREQPATPNDPYQTYSLPEQLPTGLPPSGTTWLFSDTTVYDPSVDGHPSPTGLTHAYDGGGRSVSLPNRGPRTQAR